MAPRVNATSINCIYGDGDPTGLFTAPEGTRYIDSATNTEYEFSGGAWHALGGGGSGGLPYYLGPYGIYVYGDSQTPGLYGALYFYDAGTYGGIQLNAASGNIVLNSTGGNVAILGSNDASMIVNGNIFINPGTDLYLLNLPVIAGGPAGTVWNNLGVLSIN